jgi:aryl-alcohol dehydrogenase-like predicted oxidoreductase
MVHSRETIMPAFPRRVTLGRSGLAVGKLGVASSYGAPAAAYCEAFDRGVNYFYWGSLRRGGMREAIQEIAREHRDELVVVLQSYSRLPFLMRHTLNKGLRALRLDHADVLLLGWFNSPPPPRVLDAARELRDRGLVRAVAVSGHRRTMFPEIVDDETISIWHARYNAAHRGAEREIFPAVAHLTPAERPGIATYTTTRWGHLCDPRRTPAGERTPNGTDCYRFAISHPAVDLCLAGPANRGQMRQALEALELGPMEDQELAWMRRVGDHVYRGDRTSRWREGPGAPTVTTRGA